MLAHTRISWTETMWALLYVLMICLITGSQAACETFVEIPEDKYDRNYSSIQNSQARPLGFQKSILYYDQDIEKPCFEVTGVSGQAIEVLFETIPETRLCIKRDGEQGTCDQRFEDCRSATSATTTLTFFCEVAQGCSESDVSFWVRITKGPLPADDPEGDWCQTRNTEYPEGLATLPAGQIPPTQQPDTDVAVTTFMNTFLIISAFIVVLIC